MLCPNPDGTLPSSKGGGEGGGEGGGGEGGDESEVLPGADEGGPPEDATRYAAPMRRYRQRMEEAPGRGSRSINAMG